MYEERSVNMFTMNPRRTKRYIGQSSSENEDPLQLFSERLVLAFLVPLIQSNKPGRAPKFQLESCCQRRTQAMMPFQTYFERRIERNNRMKNLRLDGAHGFHIKLADAGLIISQIAHGMQTVSPKACHFHLTVSSSCSAKDKGTLQKQFPNAEIYGQKITWEIMSNVFQASPDDYFASRQRPYCSSFFECL